ncbi:hypothetical protein BC939DRAFT_503197 [Gamsiella multidivaricata]|uniref:uncharacterized protein n=1 Tax=Gamsiella multidivaricata TaxID=101098 RepID=UPI0022207FB3|nr:uncharacterized protein BC939DRAFT_503197 [Gamsiella multidivaricata]KAI7823634.1 hypothetical protein BC939DRAFT_503197 [Gamsiella multidivaricata]
MYPTVKKPHAVNAVEISSLTVPGFFKLVPAEDENPSKFAKWDEALDLEEFTQGLFDISRDGKMAVHAYISDCFTYLKTKGSEACWHTKTCGFRNRESVAASVALHSLPRQWQQQKSPIRDSAQSTDPCEPADQWPPIDFCALIDPREPTDTPPHAALRKPTNPHKPFDLWQTTTKLHKPTYSYQHSDLRQPFDLHQPVITNGEFKESTTAATTISVTRPEDDGALGCSAAVSKCPKTLPTPRKPSKKRGRATSDTDHNATRLKVEALGMISSSLL